MVNSDIDYLLDQYCIMRIFFNWADWNTMRNPTCSEPRYRSEKKFHKINIRYIQPGTVLKFYFSLFQVEILDFKFEYGISCMNSNTVQVVKSLLDIFGTGIEKDLL